MTSAKSKRGRPEGRLITNRDQEVLKQIARDGFQTYQELRFGILNGVNRTHAWDLMKKLVTMGLVVEIEGDGGGIRGWSLSPKGQQVLVQSNVEDSWPDVRPPSYKTSFEHDRILREVRRLLCKSPAIKKWVPEHVLRAQIMGHMMSLSHRERSAKLLTVPDALFQFECRGKVFKAALELELTRKSRKRIWQKLESHITSNAFEYVFFVLNDEKLMQLLWSLYEAVRGSSPRVKFASKQNGIYFITLDNLSSKELGAEFKGIQDTFRISDLAQG